jgi:hypothetical protein
VASTAYQKSALIAQVGPENSTRPMISVEKWLVFVPLRLGARGKHCLSKERFNSFKKSTKIQL